MSTWRNIKQQERIWLLEQRKVKGELRALSAPDQWRRGVGSLHRGGLTFRRGGSTIIPGSFELEIAVESIATREDDTWWRPVAQLLTPTTAPIIAVLKGPPGIFELRLEARDVERLRHEILGPPR